MRLLTGLLASAAVSLCAFAASDAAEAKTLRYAFQSSVNSFDPHTLNETFTLAFHGNIYEGLTRRGPDLQIEPALAESWEIVEPTRWRVTLRQGVKFHSGHDFNADDVIFSFERARSSGSDMGGKIASIVEAVKVDDYTVDFITDEPNPILNAEWDTWYILSKPWAEEVGAVEVENVAATDREFHTTRNANGTGPFRLISYDPDSRTELEPFEDWWDEPEHNLTRVVFQPISQASTRVAALLSGEIDVAEPIPLQDVERIRSNDGTDALTGPELRTIFLGMDQDRDELLYSSVTGANPFQDERVRKAFYQAIDVDAIQRVVMRGQSTPSAAMVAPGVLGFPEDLERHPFDPDAARALLEEAGYGEGFSVRMNCPNDRYVNDEAICQAVVGMLGRIGIQVDLLAETRSLYFAKILAQGGYDTSFYLLGWTPGSFDSHNVLYNLVASRDEERGRGGFNNGGYSNARVDELTDLIQVETDEEARNALIREAWQILHDEVGYIPLHQQALAWGVRDGVNVVQRADNQFPWRHVVID